LTPFQIQSTCELVEILPFWMEWKWKRMPLSCFAYTLDWKEGALVRIAGLSSCLGALVRMAGVSSCMIFWRHYRKVLVRIASLSSCLGALVRIARVSSCWGPEFLSKGECPGPLGRGQCLAPLVGADLDFDVRWIRPPVDWGGG